MKAILIAALVLAAATATAQPDARPPDASPETIAEARRIHDGATTSYKLGRFDEALAGYTKAYELYRAPAFLFNLAQCHFQLKNWERAEFFFGVYLREVPAAPNRELVEERIRETRERRAAEEAAAQKKLDLEKIKLDMERTERERQAREREAALLADQAATERDRPVYKRWWFWTVVGVAAAGVATTVVLTSGTTTEVLPEGTLGTWDRR